MTCVTFLQNELWPQLPSRVQLMTLGTPGCSPSLCVSYANHAAQVLPVHHKRHLPLHFHVDSAHLPMHVTCMQSMSVQVTHMDVQEETRSAWQPIQALMTGCRGTYCTLAQGMHKQLSSNIVSSAVLYHRQLSNDKRGVHDK